MTCFERNVIYIGGSSGKLASRAYFESLCEKETFTKIFVVILFGLRILGGIR